MFVLSYLHLFSSLVGRCVFPVLSRDFLCCCAVPWAVLFSQGSKSAAPPWDWSLCCLILSQTFVLTFVGPVISVWTKTLSLGRASSIADNGFPVSSSQDWPTPLPSLIGRTLRTPSRWFQLHLTRSRPHPRAVVTSSSRISVQRSETS